MNLKILLPVLLICITIIAGCKKEENVYKTFDPPYWTEVFNAEYTATMTAIVNLPQDIAVYVQDGDELAAFVNGECRGVATSIDGLNYIMIKGLPSENARVTFKYYSSRNRYMYQCVDCVLFESDGVYGTSDSPVTLPLIVINE